MALYSPSGSYASDSAVNVAGTERRQIWSLDNINDYHDVTENTVTAYAWEANSGTNQYKWLLSSDPDDNATTAMRLTNESGGTLYVDNLSLGSPAAQSYFRATQAGTNRTGAEQHFHVQDSLSGTSLTYGMRMENDGTGGVVGDGTITFSIVGFESGVGWWQSDILYLSGSEVDGSESPLQVYMDGNAATNTVILRSTPGGSTTFNVEADSVKVGNNNVLTAESDTLATVTSRGATTSDDVIFSGDITGSARATIGTQLTVGNIPYDTNGILIARGSGRDVLIIQTDSNSADRGLAFRNSGGAYSNAIWVKDVGGGTNDGDLYFSGGNATSTITSLTDHMIISASGNVGIGTAPTGTEKLQVNGGISANQYTGNGSSLTNLDVDNVSAGTLAVARGGTGTSVAPTSGQVLIGTSGGGYTANGLIGGNAISVTNGSGTITINHDDTSTQSSVNNSGRTYIQDITLDDYGHVTGLTSATEVDDQSTTFVVEDGDTTEVTISQGKEWKFVEGAGDGASININWTDTTPGSDADPYDLTFTVTNTDKGSSQSIFKNFVVSGQSTVEADDNNDSLEFIAGTNITLTTDAINDTITINSNTAASTITVTDSGDANTNFYVMLSDTNAGSGVVPDTDESIRFNASTNTMTLNTLSLTNALAVAEGGTGATTLNNLITMGTHTTGNYVATITAGTGIASTGATSGETINHTLSVDLSELTDMTSTVNGALDELILLDSGADRRKLISEISLSEFNNDSGWTSNTGTVTSIATNNGITGGTITASGTVGLTGQALALHNLGTNGLIARTGAGTVAARTITAGSLIDITNGNGVSGNPTINVDLSELTDMTAAAVGTDELVILDSSLQRRKAINEISIGIFNTANQIALTTDTTGNYVQQGTTSGNGISGAVNSEGGTFTVTSNATNLNTASTIVFRDASGNFSAGTITAALSGRATTADNVNIDNVTSGTTYYVTFVDGTTNTERLNTDSAALTYNATTETFKSRGDVTTDSDIRLKNELPELVKGIEVVDKLRPIKYVWKQPRDNSNNTTRLGFSAQELLEIVPEVVHEDDNGYYSVSYGKLVPVLVKAIQELTEEVRELKKKVGE